MLIFGSPGMLLERPRITSMMFDRAAKQSTGGMGDVRQQTGTDQPVVPTDLTALRDHFGGSPQQQQNPNPPSFLECTDLLWNLDTSIIDPMTGVAIPFPTVGSGNPLWDANQEASIGERQDGGALGDFLRGDGASLGLRSTRRHDSVCDPRYYMQRPQGQ